MRQGAKSMLSFPWVMSLFGVTQLRNILWPHDPPQAIGQGAAAFDTVMCAMTDQFNDVLRSTCKMGDRLQRGIVDVMWGLLTLEAGTSHSMLRMTLTMLQQSAEVVRLLMPEPDSRVAWQELSNKLQAFDLFQHVDTVLQLPEGWDVPLPELVAKAYALEPYRAAWATEGLGYRYAEAHWESQGTPWHLLTTAQVQTLPARSLLPLHTGMGLSLANRLLQTVNPESPVAQVHTMLQQFVTLCRDNSRKGYVGAALEALGLVARNLYPHMVPIIDQQLWDMDSNLAGYFWHGLGRALYFAPTNFMPCTSSPWRAVELAQQEPPHALGRRNALAGLLWAATLVNIRQPEIIEAVLKHHGHLFFESDALSNGVSAALMVWQDVTQDHAAITAFCQHHPGPASPSLERLWNDTIREPCTTALQCVYPVLQEQGQLGAIFRYQSLAALVDRAAE